MLRELKLYALSATVTAGLLVWVFDLRHCDLRVPLYDATGNDALQSLAWFKTMQDTGWVHVNDRLGAPGVIDMYDFPAPQFVNHIIIKSLCVLSGDAVMAHNLFFFLGFFLSGWSCLFVLRRFAISGPVALAGGLLFAFLPAHFWRATWHVTLGFYAAVPLGVMLCLWICTERPLFVARRPSRGLGEAIAPGGAPALTRPSGGPSEKPAPGGAPALTRPSGTLSQGERDCGPSPARRAAAAVVIALLMTGSGVYYAWFMGFFLIVSGLVVWLRRPRWALPFDATVCLAIFVIGIALQAVPIVIHWRTHGRAPQALRRSPGVSQSHGLSVAELVLPTIGHRIPAWRVVESRRSVAYGADRNDPMIGARIGINEKYYSALGVIGSAGFLFLCLVILASPAGWLERLSPMADLARLNIAGVLLGSGFALIFEYVVPAIRMYNRIGVYVAFFSIFAAALLFERFGLHDGRSPAVRRFLLAALVIATALGLLDEIPGVMRPDHRAQSAAYAEERAYVHSAEVLLEPDAMVFELPYVDYPESAEIQLYDLFRPYLHSSRLRFSYGASRGTRADIWQRTVAGKPLRTMVSELCRAGFTGLHVDLRLDAEQAKALRAELDRELGPADVTAKQGQWRFYRLGYAQGALPATQGALRDPGL
jgi:hypothetical protein